MLRPNLLHLALLGGGLAAPSLAAVTADPAIIVVAPKADAFNAPKTPDRDLARMRGGVLLPNGFDVAIGIDIQTRVDGLLVLHTIYSSDAPVIGARVFTDGLGGDRLAPATATVETPSSPGAPVIATARAPSGTTIAVSPPTGSTTVNLVNGPQATWLTAAGQNEVPVTPDGPAATTGPGTFSLQTGANGLVSTLKTNDLTIAHLIGQATGAVVANVANDRTIDTVSSINIDFGNAMPLFAASTFASELLSLDAVRAR